MDKSHKSHNLLSRGVSHHLQPTSLDLSPLLTGPHREQTDYDATAISSSLILIDLHKKKKQSLQAENHIFLPPLLLLEG